jgi:aspartate kinase
VSDPLNGSNGVIKAVTAILGQRLITIEGRGMLGVPGVAARAFGAVASTGTSVPLITQASSEQSICFAVPTAAAAGVVSALEQAFSFELARRDIDRIWASQEVVIVTLVGAACSIHPIAGKIFSALEKSGQCDPIAQGCRSLVSLVVAEGDADLAVRTLHELIVPSQKKL